MVSCSRNSLDITSIKFSLAELWAGTGSVSWAARSSFCIKYLLEREPMQRKLLTKMFPEALIAGEFENGEWKSWGHVDAVVGGPACQPFSKAGLQLGANDPRANGMLDSIEVAAHCRAKIAIFEITPEFVSSDHEHGMFAASVVKGMKHGMAFAPVMEVQNAEIGGRALRKRVLLPLEPVSGQETLAPFEWQIEPGVQSSSLRGALLPIGRLGSSVNWVRRRKDFIRQDFDYVPHKPHRKGTLIFGGAHQPIVVGSKVFFRTPGRKTWRVAWVGDTKVALMPFNRPRERERIVVSKRGLMHLSQRLPVISIDSVTCAATVFNEGPQGNGRVLILDTRFRSLCVRSLEPEEVWRANLSMAHFSQGRKAGITAVELGLMAGAAIATPTAQLIVRTLEHRLRQYEGVVPTGMTPLRVGRGQCWLEMVVLSSFPSKVYVGPFGRIFGAYVRPDNQVYLATIGKWCAALGVPEDLVFMTARYARGKGLVASFGCVTDCSPREVPGFAWRRVLNQDSFAVQAAVFRFATFVPKTEQSSAIVERVRQFAFRSGGTVLPLAKIAKQPVLTRESPEIRDLKRARDAIAGIASQCTAELQQDLLQWAMIMAPSDQGALPVSWQQKSAPWPVKKAARFAPLPIIPVTEEWEPPAMQAPCAQVEVDIADLLQPWAIKEINEWLATEKQRILDMFANPTELAVPGRPLALGRDAFTPLGLSGYWNTSDPRHCVPLDFKVPQTHWNRKGMEEVFRDTPDRALLSCLRHGVWLPLDLTHQTFLAPHMTTMPMAAASNEKEIQRMTGLGWFERNQWLPCVPCRCTQCGGVARKLEKNRWRKTNNLSCPHQPLLDTNRDPVISFNQATKADRMLPYSNAFKLTMAFLGIEPNDGLWEIFSRLSRTKHGRYLIPYMGDHLPKEIKPRVSSVMRDLAILRWMAKMAGEEVFMFTDDFKDFFCQFKLHPSITWTQCFVWLCQGEVCTYRELVMGFGGRPFSNIGQRFSNMLALEFMRRLYKIQLENESKLPAKLQAVLQYRRRFLRGDDMEQNLLARINTFTDDTKVMVVGSMLFAQAVKVWAQLVKELRIIMAIPAKRKAGQEVVFCGLHWYSNQGFVALPSERKVRLLADLTCYVEDRFDLFPNDFASYRSLVGKLVSALPLTQLGRSNLYGLYHPYPRCNVLGPASTPVLTAFIRGQLKVWRAALQRSSACPLTQGGVEEPPCVENCTVVYADARKDEKGASLGWYFHGFWTSLVPTDVLAQLHITHLEVLASCCGLLDCFQLTGSERMLVQADASASESTLVGSAHASILQIIHHTFMGMAFTKKFCNTSSVSLVKGLVNVMADLPSRLEVEKMVAIGRLDGLKLIRFEPQKATVSFLEQVVRALTPLEQFRSQACSSNDAGDGPIMEWLKQVGRSEFELARQRRKERKVAKRSSKLLKVNGPRQSTPVVRIAVRPERGAHKKLRKQLHTRSKMIDLGSAWLQEGSLLAFSRGELNRPVGQSRKQEANDSTHAATLTSSKTPTKYASSLTLAGLRDVADGLLERQPRTSRGVWRIPPMAEHHQRKLREVMEKGTPDNTMRHDQSAWNKWAAFCRLKGVQPLRMDQAANTGLDLQGQYEEQMLQIEFIMWQEEWVQGRPSRGAARKALPSTLLANLRSVRRIHRKMRLPMAPVPTLADIEKGLNASFAEKYGAGALRRKAKTPITREAIERIVCMRPYVRLPVCRVGDPTWFAFKAAVCLAAATGMRIDEFISTNGWSKRDGSRGHLSWIFEGRHRKWLSKSELLRLGPGDSAVVMPMPAKADRHLKYFGSKPMYFPITDSCFSAAAALRDLELSFPVPYLSRDNYPFIPISNAKRAWTESELRTTFKAALSTVVPAHEAKLYSWHSFRVYLACAMQTLGCSDSQVQAFVRWRSAKSVPYYQQLGRRQYEDMMRRVAVVEVDTGCLERMPIVSEETQLVATMNMLPAGDLAENEGDGWESQLEEE